MCVFSNGYVDSNHSPVNVGSTNTANECAILVQTSRPLAVGVTWYADGSNECFAEFGNQVTIIDQNAYKACLFTGKYIASGINSSCHNNIPLSVICSSNSLI